MAAITITPDSATIGVTEYFLASDSTSATFQTNDCILQVVLDVNVLAAGDEFLVQFYEKVNGGTARVYYDARLNGVQPRPHWISPAFIVGEGWEVSVKKISGTDRSIGWSLRKVG